MSGASNGLAADTEKACGEPGSGATFQAPAAGRSITKYARWGPGTLTASTFPLSDSVSAPVGTWTVLPSGLTSSTPGTPAAPVAAISIRESRWGTLTISGRPAALVIAPGTVSSFEKEQPSKSVSLFL